MLQTLLGGRVCGLFTLLVLFLVTIQSVYAQDHTVSGTVVSALDNQPLPGASVVETGTLNGTAADINGLFSLEVGDPNASLTVTFIGYVTQTIEIEGRNEITVSLEEDTGLLEELVVTAGGIERRERAVGYAVSEVGGEDLREIRENNVANALAGKVARCYRNQACHRTCRLEPCDHTWGLFAGRRQSATLCC